MKNTFTRVASLLCSLILLFASTTNAQKKVVSFWDFNQTRPLTGVGGDSLGTHYSYNNPYVTFAGSQDSIENTMPLFPNYTTNAPNTAKILVIGHPNGATSSYVDNGFPGSYYYEYNSNKFNYYHGSDSNGVGGNIYVRARNPVKNDTVFMYLPTIGYHNIQLNYAISASSTKGANYNIFSYSTNGGNTWNNLTKAMDTFNISSVYRPDTLQMLNPTTDASNWYPINMNFSSDVNVNNNANFVLRWVYAGANVIQTSGNNRYDNFALTGDSLCPTISLQPAKFTVCGGAGNADFYIHIIGGTAVTYQWQLNTGIGFNNIINGAPYSGATTDSLVITGAVLAMNTYQYRCIVTNVGCGNVTSTIAILTVDAALTTSITSFTNVTCSGNGSATAGANGGTSPYTYLWNDPSHQTTATASNLTAGAYTVTLTDLYGCSASAKATISQIGLALNISAVKNIECAVNGNATANASNGTPPYTYSWSDGETNATATSLTAGTFTITAKDITGCSATANGSIAQITPIRDSINGFGLSEVIHYWDFNNTLPIGGGGGDSLGNITNPLIAPYTQLPLTPGHIIYSRAHGDSILDNGTQGAAVNDLNNLPAIANVLGNDSGGIATGNLYIRSRNKDTNAYMYLYLPTTGYQNIALNYAISASSTKGALYNIFSYSTNGGNTWNNLTKAMDTFNIGGIYRPDTLQMINAVTSVSGWYPVNINFTSDASVNNNPNFIVRWQFEGRGSGGTSGNDRYDNISLSGNLSTVTCHGAANYTAVAGLKYGQAPFTYNWTPNVSSSATASNLSAGSYNVNVTDANGCSMSSNITISQPAQVTSNITSVTNVTCNGMADGGATVTAGGGTMPYAYTWSNNGKKDTIAGVKAGTYSITVTDNYGCSATATVTITQPTAITTTNYSVDDNGSHTGVAAVKASGGVAPYTYLWAPGAKTTDTIKGQSAGTYTCTIEDKDGCTFSTTVTIKSDAGIAGISNSASINIYPDPNNGYFTVTGVVEGQVIELYNYMGQKITTTAQSMGSNQPIHFDISGRPNGIYLVRVLNKDGSIVIENKIIKMQ